MHSPKFLTPTWTAAACLGLAVLSLPAEIRVLVDHHDTDAANAEFQFPRVRRPARSDAAATATFTLVDGRGDPNGGNLDALHDGRTPAEADEPEANFFFNAGSDGGRLLVDLGKAIAVQQVDSYSWHPGGRGPQVYALYASLGSAAGFNARPPRGTDPATCGWQRLAQVDTRPTAGSGGGQYAVSIADTNGLVGTYRYLLFDVARTDRSDPFGHTFYSEIDVWDRDAPAVVETPVAAAAPETFPAGDGKYEITLNTTAAPELADWARKELMPVVQDWYPRLVALLPSEGFTAPNRVTIAFRTGMGGTPASTSGNRINCNRDWFQRELKGEAIGAVVHELVHVVQQYGRAPRGNPGATRAPGWLTEGLADYLRWYLYEPQSRGAEISRSRLAAARYDGSYRITANFLNWATGKYDRDLVPQLNAAIRRGAYSEDLWKQRTGLTAPELGDEWHRSLEAKLGVPATATAASTNNTLTAAESAAGWKLLFNGKNFDGWHNFKRAGVRPGWQVRNGELVCADPHDAGDLVTEGMYEWFELELDYNISEGGNSGLMFRVTDDGGAPWATGPEVQLEDNAKASDPQRCGWLYALYEPPLDPQTGKPLDATRPAGEWNHLRLLLSPERCEHVINGVKYFDYVLDSDDFKARVAKSKFASMPGFAQAARGRLALQGDHGQVSFRNVKLRPLPAGK
jgi:hypothetical protein